MSPNCLLTDHRDPRCPTILHRILSRGVGMTRISEMPWMAQIQIESQTQVQIQPKFKFKTQIQIRTRSQTQVQIQNPNSDPHQIPDPSSNPNPSSNSKPKSKSAPDLRPKFKSKTSGLIECGVQPGVFQLSCYRSIQGWSQNLYLEGWVFLDIGLNDEDIYRLSNKIPNTRLSRAIRHVDDVIEELIYRD